MEGPQRSPLLRGPEMTPFAHGFVKKAASRGDAPRTCFFPQGKLGMGGWNEMGSCTPCICVPGISCHLVISFMTPLQHDLHLRGGQDRPSVGHHVAHPIEEVCVLGAIAMARALPFIAAPLGARWRFTVQRKLRVSGSAGLGRY